MRKRYYSLFMFVLYAFTFIGCNARSNPEQENPQIPICDSTDISTVLRDSIFHILQANENRPVLDYSVKKQYVEEEAIYWSDPGYVRGPNIKIQKDAIVICYKTETKNDDGTIKYTDNYCISYVIGDSIVIKRNSYHGRGYHGDSCVILKENNDDRFSNIESVLVREKPNYINEIAKILQK